MTASDDEQILTQESEILRNVRARTPARILVGRVGGAYRTDTQLDLREAHAAARDAIWTELNLELQLGKALVQKWGLFEVCTEAKSKNEYLLQPHLGRILGEVSRNELASRCIAGADLQVAIGDGLSVSAVAVQVPEVLTALETGAKARGWSFGQLFVVRHCRVGILNEIGELLSPRVVVLLIGERPGLATAESLSVYMAYRPQAAHTDADRNVISNIHARGVSPPDAAVRTLNLAEQMMKAECSGVRLKYG